MSVKAVLGYFTLRREVLEGECPREPPGRGNGGRVSPRAAFRCAEGWSLALSRSTGRDERLLVRGQADACPSQRMEKLTHSLTWVAGSARMCMGEFGKERENVE